MLRLPRITGLAAGAAVTAVLAAAGCSISPNHAGGSGIVTTGAYVQQPASTGAATVGYLDIRNNGDPDQLVSVSTSVGGTVQLRGPKTFGVTPVTMQDVPAIPIPSGVTTQLIPNGYHLLISGAGPMADGKDIKLTLKFEHSAPITIYALVQNPENGGSGYFLN